VDIWYILWIFGIFCGYLVYFVDIWYILWIFGIFRVFWYIFPRFGKLHHEKSGNPALETRRTARSAIYLLCIFITAKIEALLASPPVSCTTRAALVVETVNQPSSRIKL
jgi:hypothetical protein